MTLVFYQLRIDQSFLKGYKIVRKGQFAYATIHLEEGSIGILDTADQAVISPMYTVFETDAAKVFSPYLIRLLKSDWALAKYQAMGNGSVHRRRSIPFETLGRLIVRLPPLEEQRRIAAILDKADSLRKKRQEAARLADDFLRAVFLDMFGDPVANTRRWPERTIQEVASVTTGNTPSREVPAYYGNAIEWIKSDNINTPDHWLTRSTEGLSDLGATLGRTAPAGSILMTCIAGSASCIGNIALADRKVAFNQQINALTPCEGVESEFLYALLLFSKRRIQAASTNSMKGMVSKSVLEQVKLIWPPAKLHAKFAKSFRRVHQLRLRMDAADPSGVLSALQNRLLA